MSGPDARQEVFRLAASPHKLLLVPHAWGFPRRGLFGVKLVDSVISRSSVAPRAPSRLDERVATLIIALAIVASGTLIAMLRPIAETVAEEPTRVVTLIALTLVLQLFSVPVYGRGSVSVSAIGVLASTFVLDTGTAMAIAVFAAFTQWIRSRGDLYKAAFDATKGWRLGAAILAGCVYAAVNNGLLCLAMSLAERTSWRAVWSERFHWARFHFVLFGPLALADTIAALSRSMDAKDAYTGGHTERVAALAVGLARHLGFSGEELEAIEIGALLHDVGKIGIPEQILRKQAPLDEREWEVIRTHPVISDYILSELDLHPFVRQCARSSHERMDGAGYPDGLAGEDIPLPARIVLVADAFDALTTVRPYRAARPPLAALAEIRANAGTQFCEDVVVALEKVWRTKPELLQPSRDE